MPSVSFAIDSDSLASGTAIAESNETDGTDVVLPSGDSQSELSVALFSSHNVRVSSNSRHSQSSAARPRRNDATRRRSQSQRKSSTSRRSSFFNDVSRGFDAIFVPAFESLRDEAFCDEASSFSSRSGEGWYTPYLDDTMVTYNTRTRSGSWRKKCGAIVNHPCTQHCILMLITTNAVLMGIMTFDFVLDNPDVLQALVIVDWVFLALFAVEVILQLIWHGRTSFGDPWLIFDVVILSCSWLPELRIFRFARVINRLEILQNLTRAIALVMPRMFSIALFLSIVIYTYSVLFTELFRDVQFEEGVNYFESLPASMFTCFEMMTLEWAHIARDLQSQSFSWLPIITFVVICGIIFVNLILAVICDAVAVLGVDWSGRNQREKKTLWDLQKQIVDAQNRIQNLKELLTQLTKNQINTLQLLQVQLAKQLDSAEALSNLLTDDPDQRPSKRHHFTRQNMLTKLTQDNNFREQNLITKLRILSGLILESDFFEFFIFIVICTDCLIMGVATFDSINDSEHTMQILDTITFVFLLIYTVEASMGFVYLGWGVFRDPWMAFDVLIVVTSWIADLLQGLQLKAFRAIRIVRAFRLIAVLHTLRDLVTAIGTAIPRVSKVMPLVFLIFYIFAVLFVELFRDVQYDDGVSYFGRLDLALFTCLQMMTMEWAELARESLEKTGLWWTNFLFVLFVMVSGMLFFDVIKATVCDAVAVINGRSRRLADIKKCRRRIKRLAKAVDSVSRQICHTVNFQNHINRMMLYELQIIASKSGLERKGQMDRSGGGAPPQRNERRQSGGTKARQTHSERSSKQDKTERNKRHKARRHAIRAKT